MSKYVLNEDGSVTLPLRSGETVTMPEPSIAELAEMTGWVIAVDAAMPALPAMPDKGDQAGLGAVQDVLRKRTEAMYATDAPYGTVIVRMVKLLAGQEITLADLPGWAASPSVTNAILGHWQTPLAGED